jgi:hypothetical protein
MRRTAVALEATPVAVVVAAVVEGAEAEADAAS